MRVTKLSQNGQKGGEATKCDSTNQGYFHKRVQTDGFCGGWGGGKVGQIVAVTETFVIISGLF